MHIPISHSQLHDAANFLTKTDTTSTVNTAAHFLHRNKRPYIFVKNNVLFFCITTVHWTVANRHILKLAFTTLITNRTVQWVIDQ
ncbi:MAG: hypothetical protein ACD_10C00911G0001 [uncultured bacterium]|nr:MAG: hypothetical protein ACD_10C00911G0001 [uncultured bacterium]